MNKTKLKLHQAEWTAMILALMQVGKDRRRRPADRKRTYELRCKLQSINAAVDRTGKVRIEAV